MKNLNKNFWKKLSSDLTEYASKNGWKNYHSIKIEHTSLFPMHEVGRGPNSGENTLLDFNTRLIEAKAIHFQKDSYGIEIYYEASNSYGKTILFDVRKKHKTATVHFNLRCKAEHQFGWLVKELCKKIESRNEYLDEESFEKQLLAEGYSIVKKFKYTGQIIFRMPHHYSGCIHPQYIKQLKDGLEIGWVSSGTYNGIPNVVKITRSRGLKTNSLSKLGIETSGYYDHHYKCEILPSQANKAKAFFKSRFKRGA